MKIRLISFATPNFYFAQYKLLQSAKRYGVSDVKLHNHKEFSKTQFYNDHIRITKQPRGAGYWIWKAYYILENLAQLKDDDILIYCDAGTSIIADLEPVFRIVKESSEGIVLFENYQGSAYYNKSVDFDINYNGLYVEPNKNKYWCKRDVFDCIDSGGDRLYDSPQIDANIMFFKKTVTSVKFVSEWLEYCKDPQLLTDQPSLHDTSDLKCFFGHVHDQSIISVLAAKWNLILYRAPTQFGNHFKLPFFRSDKEYLLLPYSQFPKENSLYGTLFSHTRFRTNPLWKRIQDFILLETKLIYVRIIIFIYYFSKK